MPRKKRKKPGPEPVIVKIEGDWVDALKRALHIKRPKDWPLRVPNNETRNPMDDGETEDDDA